MIYAFIFCIINSCATAPKVISVSSQQWAGGQKKTGSGTRYLLKTVVPESSKKFNIKEMCADGHILYHNTDKLNFSKNDTIKIYANKSKESCDSKKNEGWFTYEMMGETKIHCLKNIEKKDRINYP